MHKKTRIIMPPGQTKIYMNSSSVIKGGMVMPIIVEWTFTDGSKEVDRIPVSIWRSNEQKRDQAVLVKTRK
jgi:hypothetical protein